MKKLRLAKAGDCAQDSIVEAAGLDFKARPSGAQSPCSVNDTYPRDCEAACDPSSPIEAWLWPLSRTADLFLFLPFLPLPLPSRLMAGAYPGPHGAT